MTDSPLKPRIKTAILISGRGTNMNALIEAAKDANYPADIKLVISNRPKAGGLELARAHGIKAITIDHKTFENREAFETVLHKTLLDNEIELVCCAGFMRVLTASFVMKWANKLINIHPSLLPKYKGLDTHKRALKACDAEHGCTVHWVTADLDSGEIIMQDRIAINVEDTEDTLAKRVLKRELNLYPRALNRVAQLKISK